MDLDKNNFEEELHKMQEDFNKEELERKDTMFSKKLKDESESVTSELENKDKVFITDNEFEGRTNKSKSFKSKKSLKKKHTMRSRNTKSKFDSKKSSNSHSISKEKVKYVLCKDCKRRRTKKKRTVKSPMARNKRKYSHTVKMKKISSTKLLRSQSKIFNNNGIVQNIEETNESDFDINDESLYSATSIESGHNWEYGKIFNNLNFFLDDNIFEHHEFELEYFKNKPLLLVNDIFSKLDIYK